MDGGEHERHFAVAILNVEHLNEIERSLTPLLHDDEVDLLHPRPRDEHAPIINALDQLPWHEDPTSAADDAYDLLTQAIDPADDDGDVTWCRAIVSLVESPHIGSRLARRWFVGLHRARHEDRPVSIVVESTAAYAVAAHEKLIGREHEVTRWMQTAAIMSDHDERGALGPVLLIRAGRLLGPLLHHVEGRAR